MRIGILFVALLFLAGCSAEPPPRADVTRRIGPTTIQSYQPPPSLPPAVSRQLDASGYRNRICEILTDEQAVALGLPESARPGGSPEFIFCGRESKDPPLNFSLVYGGSDLFGKAYRKPNFPLGYSKLVTIAGQPALELGTAVLDGSVPYCLIVLGLANDQAIQIDMNLHFGGSGACERATRVAEAIVHNLGG